MSIPRRSRLDHMTPAELAIRAAMRAVEDTGGSEDLTAAVVLLDEAQSKVADHVDRGACRCPEASWRFDRWVCGSCGAEVPDPVGDSPREHP